MKRTQRYGPVLVIMMLLAQELYGQAAQNLTLLGNYGKGEGESKAVFAVGSLVFYGLGNKVQIASFSNPATPLKIGSVILSDIVEGLVRTSINSNQYIVASGGSKMWIINVQNPTLPSLTSTTDVAVGAVCEGIATSGSYAYVAAGSAGFKIYNISNPAAPVPVASMDTLAYCESVIISGQYAYIAAAARSHIVDITDPAVPVYVGRINAYGGYHQYMNVRAGYAYVCNYDAGLAVVNVTNPASPVNVINIPTMPRIGCILFDGNYAYAAVGDSGLKIFNVVNPAAPALVGKIGTPGRAAFASYGAISIAGTPTGHIFVSNRNPAPGISAVNVSDPAMPTSSTYLGALPSPTGSAFSTFYANNKVYAAYGTAGLRIIDVTTQSQPTLLSTLPLGGESRGVVVAGNYGFVAAMDGGVYHVNVTDGANPVKVDSFKTSRARGIAISGTHVYVATRDSGLVILDVANPVSPVWIASVRGIDVENVAAAGTVVGTSFYSSIRFYDVTDPANPVPKGSTPTLRIGNEGFAIDGSYAYVPDGDSLKIFSIADLNAPALVAKIRTGGYGYTAAVAGHYCYVASEATGVRVIDITNPASPTEAGFYDGVPQSRGLTADGGSVYAAEKLDGISVYRNDLVTSVAGKEPTPAKFNLVQNYPNPFNPSTSIVIELAGRAFITLEVYDLLGQRVALLVNKQLPAGSYNVPFNASALSSGMYLYRMHANGFTSVRKMMLLK